MHPCRLALTLMLLASPTSGWAGLCALQPLYPPCCPSPCPIDDPARELTLAQAQLAATGLLAREQTLTEWAGLVAQGLGVASSLRRIPPPPPVADDLPAAAGQPTSPTLLANWVKLSLYDPAGASSSSRKTSLNLDRLAVVRQEDSASLAMSLAATQALSSSVAPTGSFGAAAGSLRGDLDKAAAARLTLLSDLTTLQQILTQWTALQASASALAHPSVAGSGPVALPSAAPPALSATAATSAPANFDGLASASLRQQIPALQQTRARAVLAAGFAQSAGAAAQRELAPWIADPAGAWPEIMSALRRLDPTLWTDSAAKDSAAQAASRLLAALVVPASQPAADRVPLQQSLSRWLESDKQSRYWQGLDADAAGRLAALEDRVAQLQSRAVAAPSADMPGGSPTGNPTPVQRAPR